MAFVSTPGELNEFFEKNTDFFLKVLFFALHHLKSCFLWKMAFIKISVFSTLHNMSQPCCWNAGDIFFVKKMFDGKST